MSNKTVKTKTGDYLLPSGVPDSEAESMGVPIGIHLGELYDTNLAEKVINALAERGIKSYDDIVNAPNDVIYQAFQQIWKLEVLRLKTYAKQEVNS